MTPAAAVVTEGGSRARWTRGAGLLALVIAASALPSVARAQSGAAGALNWLRPRQNADGTWSRDARLAARDTAVVLETFVALDPDVAITQPAVSGLAGLREQTIDLEARRLAALRLHLPEVVLADALGDLAAARTADMGWGVHGAYRNPEALDTALAARALVGAATLSASVPAGVLLRLGLLQNTDGGFAQAVGGESDVPTTAEVVRALTALGQLGDVAATRSAAVAFIVGQRNPDGGWPAVHGAASDAAATALALSVLMEAGADLTAVYPAARAYLLGQQLPDGSWLEDPYTTALAALVLGDAPADLAVASFRLSAASVMWSLPFSATAQVHNGGLSPAPATTVALYWGDPNRGGILLDTKPLAPLAVGQSADIVFSMNATGAGGVPWNGSIALFSIIDPVGAVRELTKVNNRGFAILQVLYNTDPQPPGTDRPPIFTSVPQSTATPNSVYAYQAAAFDPDGDTVTFDLVITSARERFPAGMTIDRTTGLLTWPVPPLGSDSPYSVGVNVLARDPGGATASQIFRIAVNDPNAVYPAVFLTLPSSVAKIGIPYAYKPEVVDPNSAGKRGPVTLTLLAGPEGMVFDQSIGTVLWTPMTGQEGDNIVRLQAKTIRGLVTIQSWIIPLDRPAPPSRNLVAVNVDATLAISDPQVLTVGGTVKVTVANAGDLDAPAFDVVVFEERDGQVGLGADVVLGTIRVPGLAHRETVDIDVPVSGHLLFRNNRLFALADARREIEETKEDDNLQSSGREKRFVPTPGALTASLKLEWENDWDIEHPPLVAHFTDDNGDGKAGAGDIPDIWVWDSFGTQHLLDGKTAASHFQVPLGGDASLPAAIVDVDGDGFPEYASTGGGAVFGFGTQLYNHDGTNRWSTPAPSSGSFYNAPMTVTADLDGDGRPELISTYGVIDSDGRILCEFPSRPEIRTATEQIAVDLNLDGTPEIVTGTTAYRSDCSVIWNHPEYQYGTFGSTAGVAVAQLDSDPEPELVLTNNSHLRAIEHTGEVKWAVELPRSTYTSPPVLGDVDNDGLPEIALGQAEGSLRVYEADGSLRWAVNLPLLQSSTGAPALADLDGDGQLELVFNDDFTLHVYRATNGELLWETPNHGRAAHGPASGRITVADSDGDGRLDIIATTGNLGYPSRQSNATDDWPHVGLRIFGNPNWAPGRPLRHQAPYHITEIGCDQQVPAHEVPSHKAHNTYRLSAEVPEAQREALHCPVGHPDLTASYLRVDRSGCNAAVQYTARVGNGGPGTVGPGVPILFRRSVAGAAPVDVGTVLTTKTLRPGDYEDVSLAVSPAGTGPGTIQVDVDPEQTVFEVRPENNIHTFDATECGAGNRPPLFISTPQRQTQATRLFLYAPAASDPDGDPITFTLTTAPPGMMLLGPSGPLTWTPTLADLGDHVVTLEVADNRGGLDVQSFILGVLAPAFDSRGPPTVPGMILRIEADQSSYGPSSPVAISAALENQDNHGRAGHLRIDILDAADGVVATPLAEQDTLFVGPGTQGFVASFNTGVILPGPYRAVVRYEESGGVTAALANFTVASSAALAVEISTDQARYGANAHAQILSTLRNAGVTGTLSGLGATVTVLDPGGFVIQTVPLGTFDLAPADRQQRVVLFDTLMRPAGSYRARLTVVAPGGGSPTVVEHSFEIASSVDVGQPLVGQMTVTPEQIGQGAMFTIHAQLTNTGNVPLDDLVVTVRVLDQAGHLIERVLPFSVALGGALDMSETLDSAPLTVGPSVVALEARAGDRVLLNLGGSLLVLGTAPPVVSIAVPACSMGPVTPVVTVAASAPVRLDQTLDGSPFIGPSVSAEGSHLFSAVATDTNGNTGSASASFVIDRTLPVITVTGVAEGGAYRQATPAFTATDTHLTAAGATLDGAPLSSGTPVTAEGPHTLVVTASDCAGNIATTTVHFVIDVTAPGVAISVPACARGPVVPVVSVTEPNPASDVRQLDGAPFAGGAVTTEGTHTLTVTVTDRAGNATTRSVTFIVDNTPPSITLGGVADGRAYNTPVTPTVLFSDAHLTASAATLNGGPFVSGTVISGDGSYALDATASDCAGNTAHAAASFIVDRTPPVVTIDVPACNARSVTPVVTVVEANPGSDVRTLDGASYPGGPVSAAGSHTLKVVVTDVASNSTTKTASFEVDATAPTITITGVVDGGSYPAGVTPVVTFGDNHLVSSTLTLNGAPFVSGTPVTVAGSYTLVASARDCAGNQTTRTVRFTVEAPRVAGDLTQELSARAHVLIASECRTCTREEDDRDRDNHHGDDDDDENERHRERDHDDEGHSLCPVHPPAVLEAALRGAKIPFDEANGRDAWLKKLRSGRFNLFVLYQPAPSESGTAFKELNEAAWMGDGLIVIKDHADAMPSLREALGVDFGGEIRPLSSVTLLAPLSPATLGAAGTGVALGLATDAIAVGASGGGRPKIIAARHGVGIGQTLTLGWDTETSSSKPFYLSALAAGAPAVGLPLLPRGAADVRVVVRNTGQESTSYLVVHVLDSGLSSWDPLTHTLTLAPQAVGDFFLGLRLPSAAGTYAVTGTLKSGTTVLDTDVLRLTIPRSLDQIQRDVVGALNGLSLSGGQASKRALALVSLEKAARTSSASTAIGHVLDAIDRVREITSVNVTAIRIDLARLLRAYQLRWGQ